MHTFEVLDSIDAFSARLSEMGSLLSRIEKFSDDLTSREKSIFAPFGPDDQAASWKLASPLRQELKKLIVEYKEDIPLRPFHGALTELEHYFQSLELEEVFRDSDFLKRLKDDFENYLIAHDVFTKNWQIPDALLMLQMARVFRSRLDAAQLAFRQVREHLLTVEDEPKTEEETTELKGVSLQFVGPTSVLRFSSRLTAFSSLYSELCQLFKISEQSYELRIVRIESGSQFFEFLGFGKCVELACDLIRNSLGWMYRTYTTEGKLASIPKKAEDMEAVLKLSDRLEKYGLKPAEMRENVAKAGVELSKQLTELLRGEPVVVVNRERISVAPDFEKKYIEEAKRLRIEDQTQRSENEAQEPPDQESQNDG